MAKRRANGEGTITKRKDGRYQAAAYVYRPNGTRARKFVYGKTREEVADQLIEMQDLTRKGVPALTSAMPLGDFLSQWLTRIAPARLKPATLASYEPMVRLYIAPALGRKRLNRLSPTDVRKFVADFEGACLCCLRGVDKARPVEDRECCAVGKCCHRRPAPRTVQYTHAVLRSALQQAVREELIVRNVARVVETPRVPHAEVQPLDRGEALLLLRAAGSHRLHALWHLLVATGLRRGEVLGLTWGDIDLTARQLRVRRNLQRLNRGLIFGTPKTARSLRTVALPASCVAQLKRHLVEQEAERAQAGQDWEPFTFQPNGLVFTTSTGRAIDPRGLNRMLTVLCRTAHVRPVRVHDLRHTAASLMLAEGVAVRTIMETLGHANISMTMDVYGHVMETTLRDAADRMDRALGTAADTSGNGDDEPPTAGALARR
ncbi:tyrosine-type recombinase/integrase [Streptacidiphilus rugosus]|uniref:tyrosine-type recombinase/integrase n=1 Tax=Streptacidiphilus rugosus TaxID=405783 RepID=UPI000559FB86|nr:tyrosine-type recombinase/integrase [Streptacidiphilus rugosus]